MPHPPRKESRNASEALRGVQNGIAIWNMAFQEWVQLFPSGMKNELRLVRFPPLRSGKRKPVRRFPRPRKVTPIVPIAGAVQWAARSRQAHRNNRTVRPLSRKRFRKTARSGAVAEETEPIGCFSRLPCPHSGCLLDKVEMRPRSARLVGGVVGVAEGGVSIHARTGRATLPAMSLHPLPGCTSFRQFPHAHSAPPSFFGASTATCASTRFPASNTSRRRTPFPHCLHQPTPRPVHVHDRLDEHVLSAYPAIQLAPCAHSALPFSQPVVGLQA